MDLMANVEDLKGIGPKTAEILRKFGIKTVRDFFYNLPRDYENFSKPSAIREIRPGKVVVKGKISDLSSRRAKKRNLSITEGVVRDSTGAIRVVWFNQSYRLRQFAPDKEYYFTGVYELKNGRFQLTSPSAALASEVEMTGGPSPVYVAHGGLKSGDFRRLMSASRDRFAEIPDLLPTVASGVRKESLFKVHFPESVGDVQVGREYLAYEEIFELLFASKLNRRENEKLRAVSVPFEVERIREFVGSLPFRLTNAQRRSAWEIFQDMEKNVPMNRLLQGDVGSGKTMVATLSAYEAVGSNKAMRGITGARGQGGNATGARGQVAILAPTAILASQHYESIGPLLSRFGVRTALLTAATKKKTELKKQIARGEVDIVIGTHAILTDDTEFLNLTLVIIDEQHRFGVEQRQRLMLKSPSGLSPHLLAMTATPIPRSLQLTVFGDLSVSILDELPAGRQPVTTQIMNELEMREKLYPLMLDIHGRAPDTKRHGEHARGQQIYWICKAIEEGTSEATSVKKRAKQLSEVFPKLTIEFLHGKMKPLEKDAVMERFADGVIDVLVSTTVVEVGVDVPNATLMIIENAETYGLAQLHQLRGRVGRGASEAFCVLLTSGDTAPTRRLREVEKSNDGFHLAEVDLKLRGPGEIYGSLQHGALDLRIATLSDTRLIARAQKDVEKFLTNPENMVKYKELMANIQKYQQITTLN